MNDQETLEFLESLTGLKYEWSTYWSCGKWEYGCHAVEVNGKYVKLQTVSEEEWSELNV